MNRTAVVMFALSFAFFAPAVASAQTLPAPTPSPSARQSLSDAWWTGPMLAPSAGTLPHGHILVEPYLYDVIQYGNYDSSGTVKGAPHANGYGSLTYIIYGLTDRLNVGIIPTFGYTSTSGGPNSSTVGLGDIALLAQYRIAQFRSGRSTPTTSIAVQETFPTGKYDNLGTNPNNGFGSGVYSTKVSLYMQSYAWVPNGRILRMRLNFSDSFSGGAPVNGASVYGTSGGFHGSVKPGGTFTIDAAGEYTVTRNWVVASDLAYSYTGNTTLSANGLTTNLGDGHSLAFAPAVEYNWTPNAGILVGLRIFPSGRNTSASVTPAIAINLLR